MEDEDDDARKQNFYLLLNCFGNWKGDDNKVRMMMIQEHNNVIGNYVKRGRQRVKMMMMIQEYRNVNFTEIVLVMIKKETTQ